MFNCATNSRERNVVGLKHISSNRNSKFFLTHRHRKCQDVLTARSISEKVKINKQENNICIIFFGGSRDCNLRDKRCECDQLSPSLNSISSQMKEKTERSGSLSQATIRDSKILPNQLSFDRVIQYQSLGGSLFHPSVEKSHEVEFSGVMSRKSYRLSNGNLQDFSVDERRH